MQSSKSINVDASKQEKLLILDELFKHTKRYESSEEFRKLIDFVCKFPFLSPYNGMLVQLQRPGVQITLTRNKWAKYNRTINDFAMPMVILVPFGPVDFVFDVIDTQGNESIPEELTNPFKTSGSIPKYVLEIFMASIRNESILVNEYPAHVSYAGLAIREEDKFSITINSALTPEEKFSALVHELAHIYCGHLGTTLNRWWKDRNFLKKESKEFEAESIAYIVCHRSGLTLKSDQYLRGYLDKNSALPEFSVDTILTVSGYIESMKDKYFRPKDKRGKKTGMRKPK
jgi:hypothetical protein